MPPVAQQFLQTVAFLMVALSMSMLMTSPGIVSGLALLAGLVLFGVAHHIGSSVRNKRSPL